MMFIEDTVMFNRCYIEFEKWVVHEVLWLYVPMKMKNRQFGSFQITDHQNKGTSVLIDRLNVATQQMFEKY